MLRKILLTGIMLLSFSLYAYAQTGTLEGTVSNAETGDPIIGANVYIPQLETGDQTNVDGEYEIEDVPVGTYTIEVTFVGYAEFTEQFTVEAGTNTLDVELEEGVALEEVVISSYGTDPKRDRTGSITQVSSRDVNDVSINTPDQALQGRTAGVQVISESGAPGGGLQIRVRGVGSINAGNDPLYIVDGVPINNNDATSSQGSSNALANLNPQDIESLEVLKDAAAAAIYGAEAANGVVLITTKRGQAGDTQFSLNTSVGLATPIEQWDVLGGEEWFNLFDEIRANSGENSAADYFACCVDPNNIPTYDWQDAVYRNGLTNNISLSASGGDESTRFYMSAGYEKDEGQIIRSDFDRFSFRTNIDHEANDRLTFRTTVGVTSSRITGAIEDGNFINGPFFGSARVIPFTPIYDDEGAYHYGPLLNVSNSNYNIVQGVNEEVRDGRTNSLVGNVNATYDITSSLALTYFLGIDYRQTRDSNYRPSTIPAFAGTGGSAFEANRESINYNTNAVLNYSTTINQNHNITGLLGAEYKKDKQETFTASGQEFPNELFQTLQNAATPTGASGFITNVKAAGIFGKAEYDYDETYFLTGTLRYDGSSRFGEQNKYGLFYAISGAWDMSQEDFMSDIDWIDQFQPRASYGVTGNNRISNFASRSLITTGGTYNGSAGLSFSQLGNTGLGWEEERTFNVGIDWDFFASRLTGTVEYYRSINADLLLSTPLPTDSGFGSISDNVGKVLNQGVEVEIGTVNIDQGGFFWESSFNLGYNFNEIQELVGDQQQLNDGTQIGYPLGMYWLPEWAGVNPADGRPMWYDEDGEITYSPTADDEKFAGKTNPSFTGGFSNSFAYGNLSLDVLLQFNFDQQTFRQNSGFFLEQPWRQQNTLQRVADNRWQEPGDIEPNPKFYLDGFEPGTGTAGQTTSSTWYISDVDYIRLKDVRLNYALPVSLVDQLDLRGITVFVQGRNLYTWTNYPGLDPEEVGTASASYPNPKLYSAGINIDF